MLVISEAPAAPPHWDQFFFYQANSPGILNGTSGRELLSARWIGSLKMAGKTRLISALPIGTKRVSTVLGDIRTSNGVRLSPGA